MTLRPPPSEDGACRGRPFRGRRDEIDALLHPPGHRRHAPGRARPVLAAGGRPHPGEARKPEPRGLQEGPDRAPDDRGCGKGRHPAPGAGRRRADERQHRDRAGDRVRGEGISVHRRHVEGKLPGEGADDAGPGRRGGPGPAGAGVGRRPGLRRGPGAGRGRDAADRRGEGGLPGRPVPLGVELPRPLPADRARDPGAEPPSDRRVLRLRRDGGDLRRMRRRLQGGEPGDALLRRRAGGRPGPLGRAGCGPGAPHPGRWLRPGRAGPDPAGTRRRLLAGLGRGGDRLRPRPGRRGGDLRRLFLGCEPRRGRPGAPPRAPAARRPSSSSATRA